MHMCGAVFITLYVLSYGIDKTKWLQGLQLCSRMKVQPLDNQLLYQYLKGKPDAGYGNKDIWQKERGLSHLVIKNTSYYISSITHDAQRTTILIAERNSATYNELQ